MYTSHRLCKAQKALRAHSLLRCNPNRPHLSKTGAPKRTAAPPQLPRQSRPLAPWLLRHSPSKPYPNRHRNRHYSPSRAFLNPKPSPCSLLHPRHSPCRSPYPHSVEGACHSTLSSILLGMGAECRSTLWLMLPQPDLVAGLGAVLVVVVRACPSTPLLMPPRASVGAVGVACQTIPWWTQPPPTLVAVGLAVEVVVACTRWWTPPQLLAAVACRSILRSRESLGRQGALPTGALQAEPVALWGSSAS
mmetsp:Transcript_5260/g.9440  ORF Transcript_5260/g.9440 Transcript_5260/m.9440 type:complete len:248 (+) Transcript_5260:1308-2051(+)